MNNSLKSHFVPAILAYSKKEATEKLAFVSAHYPHARLHVDVMDKKFVPAGCWCSPAQFQTLAIRNAFEVHLMTQHPEKRIGAWKKAGADRIVFHIEATAAPEQVVRAIHGHNLTASVAIKPSTPMAALRLILPHIDAILIMGVEPGFAGQKFKKSVLKRIQSFHQKIPNVPITIDGGVTQQNAPLLLRAGAHELVSTSAVYGKSTKTR